MTLLHKINHLKKVVNLVFRDTDFDWFRNDCPLRNDKLRDIQRYTEMCISKEQFWEFCWFIVANSLSIMHGMNSTNITTHLQTHAHAHTQTHNLEVSVFFHSKDSQTGLHSDHSWTIKEINRNLWSQYSASDILVLFR